MHYCLSIGFVWFKDAARRLKDESTQILATRVAYLKDKTGLNRTEDEMVHQIVES